MSHVQGGTIALQSFRTREYTRGPRSAIEGVLLEAAQNVSEHTPC